jgi:hypothetical protein
VAVVPAAASFLLHVKDLGNVLAVPSDRGTLWNPLDFLLFKSFASVVANFYKYLA